MTTKLDLYLAVSALAVETLTAPAKEADAKITALLTPLQLAPEERNNFSTLFYARRLRMLELKNQPLELLAAVAAPPTKK